jgi:hypothetical protein
MVTVRTSNASHQRARCCRPIQLVRAISTVLAALRCMRLLDPLPACEHSFCLSSPRPLHGFAPSIDPFPDAVFRQQYCSLLLLDVQSSLPTPSTSCGSLSASVLSKLVLLLFVRAPCNDIDLVLKQYCLIRAFTRQQILSDWMMACDAFNSAGKSRRGLTLRISGRAPITGQP